MYAQTVGGALNPLTGCLYIGIIVSSVLHKHRMGTISMAIISMAQARPTRKAMMYFDLVRS